MGIFDRLTERVGGIFGDFIEEVMIPDEVHQRLQRAARHYDRGEWIEALEVLDTIERIQPNIARLHHLKGLVHFHRGAPQEAARALRRAIELKETPQSHLWAGLAMEQLQEWRGAQDHLQRVLALSPEPPFAFDLHFAMGRVYLAQGRADKAIRELRKAMRLSAEQPDASVTLAEALLARGKLEAARAAIEHVGEERLEGTHANLIQARIAEEMDAPRAARAAYRRATMASGPEHERRQAHVGAARTSLTLGEVDEADTHTRAAEELSRGEPRAELHVLRGEIDEARQRYAEAIRHFELALQQNPQHGQALRGAGRISLEAGQTEAALDYFRRALDAESHRDAEASLLGQGLARLALGDLSGARQVLEEAARVDERATSPEIFFALGRVALATGDFAEAVVALRDAADRAHTPRQAEQIDAAMQQALTQLRPQWDLPARLDGPLDMDRLMRALQDYIASDSRLVDFMPATQRILATMMSPLSIAIVGEFNAGKSTLINALLGEDLVPMGVLPTTAHTGIIQYGPRQAARVIYRDEAMDDVEVDFAEAKRLMKTNADDIDHLEYTYPHPELRAIHIWDTPGFNALDPRHEEVAARALEQAEAILWVLDANQVLSQTEFDRIEDIPGGDERLLVLINKIDRLGPPGEERDAAVAHLVKYVEEHAGEHAAGCYPISALQALRAGEALDEAGIEADATGFLRFRHHLHEQLIARAGHIKTMESKRHLARLVITLAAFQSGLIQRYQRLGQQIVGARDWLDEVRAHHPRRVAEQELVEIEDRVEFMLRAVVREIEEALRPRSSWVSQRMTMSEEDREFIVELLAERFASILDASRDRVFNDVTAVEAELAERMGPVVQGLSLQDARGLNRRLEGFQDEVRVLKLLLVERVYGQIIARANGQIEAAARPILAEIEDLSDQSRWKALLRRLLPSVRDSFQRDLAGWYDTMFLAARRFCDRARRDLALLELEARYRYDISGVEARLELAGGDEISLE